MMVRPGSGATKASPTLLWTVTVLLGLGLMIAGAEVLARLAHVRVFRIEQAAYIGWAQPDPVLGWRTRPGVYRAHEGAHEPMTFLSDGSRATGAPEGTDTSALIVGCSFSAGYGVRDEETYASKLQQRFPNERIRNFAVPGYGTYQSLLLLQELLGKRGLRPRLVIYGFSTDQAERNVLTYTALEAYRAYGGQRFPPPHVEVRQARLVAFPPFVVPNWPLEQRSAAVSLLHSARLHFTMRGREQYEISAMRLLLAQMKEVAERAGARFLVATLWDGGPPRLAEYEQMKEEMRGAGIEEINVTHPGLDTRSERFLVGGSGHPGPVIHSWWADQIGAWMTRERTTGAVR